MGLVDREQLAGMGEGVEELTGGGLCSKVGARKLPPCYYNLLPFGGDGRGLAGWEREGRGEGKWERNNVLPIGQCYGPLGNNWGKAACGCCSLLEFPVAAALLDGCHWLGLVVAAAGWGFAAAGDCFCCKKAAAADLLLPAAGSCCCLLLELLEAVVALLPKVVTAGRLEGGKMLLPCCRRRLEENCCCKGRGKGAAAGGEKRRAVVAGSLGQQG